MLIHTILMKFSAIHAIWLSKVTTSITALLAKLITAKLVDHLLIPKLKLLLNNQKISTLSLQQLARLLINSVLKEIQDLESNLNHKVHL